MLFAGCTPLAEALTIDQILQSAYDSTSNSLRLSLSAADAKDVTSLTNTVTYPQSVTHETSGTPAAGIGVGYSAIQETSASNDETVGAVNWTMTDVTATSEDADFLVLLMDAGAAMAERFRVTSDGILTLINGEQIDNATTNGVIAFVGAAIDVQGGDVTLENDEVIDNGTNGTVQIQSDTALTNTVSPELSLLHTTSGSPAAGIGVGISFVQETSASNNETGMSLDAVVDDATGASEDFSFSVQLMAAGAAKAEKFAVESTGIITLVNSGTISNAVNGIITVDEPNSATNTVTDIFKISNTTSGTAANGNGTGLAFEGEDDGGALQVGMTIDMLSTDVTAASEDYDFVLSLMDAGSAAAEVLRVTSDGVLTLENSGTIDNTTNGTILITEPTIDIVGALKLEQCTIADGDDTPDVAGCHWLTTSSNTAPTAITDLDNPQVGAEYCIIIGNATNPSTLADSGNFALSAAWTPGLDDIICLYVQADNDYIEISRSDN